jgi:hypothetical protein
MRATIFMKETIIKQGLNQIFKGGAFLESLLNCKLAWPTLGGYLAFLLPGYFKGGPYFKHALKYGPIFVTIFP